MNFIYVIHLMCWNYLIDLITDNRSSSGDGNNKGGRALRARPPLLFPSPLLVMLLLLPLLCMIRSVSWFQYNKWMT